MTHQTNAILAVVAIGPLMIGAATSLSAQTLSQSSAQSAARPTSNTKIDLGGLVPRFNGTWQITRTYSPRCPVEYSVFAIRIKNGVVSANGGDGTVQGNGRIAFPGRDNSFRGFLRDTGTGSGTYSGRCTGTFTASRTKP
jgi:hypothetical protein